MKIVSHHPRVLQLRDVFETATHQYVSSAIASS
jgi:hypothetical protein